MNNRIHVAYDDVYLGWKLGTGRYEHPTNPIRAKLATELLSKSNDIIVVRPDVFSLDRDLIESIHDKEYVSEVIDKGTCGQWSPADKHKGLVATHMFAGTVRLAEMIVDEKIKIGFNPQGAKHHAQYDYSSGFCVFNDMAYAAKFFKEKGLKAMYIDWDAHHGDGVENLLADDSDLVTCSIHQKGIFPGTGLKSDPKKGIYNWPLKSGDGDDKFKNCMQQIELLADKIKPDVVLLATGADAHKTDPLSSLNFDYKGYRYAAEVVGRIAAKHSNGRVLIGGAGGYQPFSHTPKVWANVVTNVHKTCSRLTV